MTATSDPPERLFERVLLATGLADTATGVFDVAAVVLVATSSGSTRAVALVTAASTLPWLLFALPAGALADRASRPRAIGAANLLRGLVMLATAAAVGRGLSPVPVLVGAVFVVGALQTVVDTAAEAMVPDLVAAHRLSDANGLLAVTTRLSQQFAGPLLAGGLLALAAGAPSLVAGAVCCLAALLVGTLPSVHDAECRPLSATEPDGRPARGQGLRLVLRRPALATLVAVGGGTTVANTAFLTVLAVYAVAPSGLALSPSQYGLLLGSVGVGAAVGSVLTGRLQALIGRGSLLALTRVGWAAVFAAPAILHGVPLGVAMAAGSAFGGMWSVAATSLRQTSVEPRQRGQVAGVQRLVQYGSAPVGAVLGGASGGHLDPRLLLLGCSATSLCMIVPVRRWLR